MITQDSPAGENLEIRPGIVNSRSVFGMILLLVPLGLGVFLLPKTLNLFLEFPGESEAGFPLLITSLVISAFLLITLWAVISSWGNKISVKGNLVYFSKKTWAGLGRWKLAAVIDFAKVAWVKDRQQVQYIFVGKGLMPVILTWLVFEMDDGRKEELLNVWEQKGVENLFYYMKGKFTKIKFATKLVRDRAEKLAGGE